MLAEFTGRPLFQPSRPWSDFFGKCTMPTKANVLQRLEDNLLFFQTNYVSMIIIALLLSNFPSLLSLLTMPLVAFLWWFTFYRKQSDIAIGKLKFTKTASLLILTAIASMEAYFYSNHNTLVVYSVLAAAIIFGHGMLRTRNFKITPTGPVKRIYDPEEVVFKELQRTMGEGVNRRATTPQATSYTQPSIAMQSASIGINASQVPFSTSAPSSYNASPIMNTETPNVNLPSFSSSIPSSAPNLENRSRLRNDELKQKKSEMANRLKEQFGLN